MSSKKASATGNLRTLNLLLREVDLIETKCGGNKNAAKSKLDDFQSNKLELAGLLRRLKDDIKTHRKMEENEGKTANSIAKRREIERDLKSAKEIEKKMELAYQHDHDRYDRGKKDALEPKELHDRKELADLLKQDLDYVSTDFSGKGSAAAGGGGGGFTIARDARKRRAQKKNDGLMGSSEPQPLTAKQQAFIQESIERDAILDEKLDIIHQGVKQLGQVAYDINTELDKQSAMLDEVERKMDKVTEKLENRNAEMKKILDASGGATRWCPIMILCVILLAILGYIYSAVS